MLKKLKSTIKRYYKNTKDAIKFSWGLIKSCWVYTFKSKDEARIFEGFFHWEIACKYAERRTIRYKPAMNQRGKLNGVLPIEGAPYSLLVCNKLELKHFKKVGILHRNINVRKMFNKSYFTTNYPKLITQK